MHSVNPLPSCCPLAITHLHAPLQLREGVDTEIAAASREGKRAGRSKAAATSAAKLSGVQAKYNRFDAEVGGLGGSQQLHQQGRL